MALNIDPHEDPDYVEQQALLADKYKNEIAQRERLRQQFFHTVEQLGKRDCDDAILKAAQYLIKIYFRRKTPSAADVKLLKDAVEHPY